MIERYGRGAYERGAPVPQKYQHYASHQAYRDQQAGANLLNGAFHEVCSAIQEVNYCISRRLPRELGHESVDGFGYCDGVGVCLSLNREHYSREHFPVAVRDVGKSCQLAILLNAIDRIADVTQMDRRTVLIGHDHLVVGLRIRELSVALHGVGTSLAV
jgi:hypothetical protein